MVSFHFENCGFQGLKNASFPQRSNCSVTLYQDAHHHPSFQPPVNLCRTPRKLWEDVYKAIEDAQHLIYIAGWSFNPKLVLVSEKSVISPSILLSVLHISKIIILGRAGSRFSNRNSTCSRS